jgi:hypothetical protein
LQLLHFPYVHVCLLYIININIKTGLSSLRFFSDAILFERCCYCNHGFWCFFICYIVYHQRHQKCIYILLNKHKCTYTDNKFRGKKKRRIIITFLILYYRLVFFFYFTLSLSLAFLSMLLVCVYVLRFVKNYDYILHALCVSLLEIKFYRKKIYVKMEIILLSLHSIHSAAQNEKTSNIILYSSLISFLRRRRCSSHSRSYIFIYNNTKRKCVCLMMLMRNFFYPPFP